MLRNYLKKKSNSLISIFKFRRKKSIVLFFHGPRPNSLVLFEKNDTLNEFKRITPLFNRMVLFQTTSAWHGVPEPINCPPEICRNAIGLFYLTKPRENHLTHKKALYAAYGAQEGSKEIEELIIKRSSDETAKSVY